MWKLEVQVQNEKWEQWTSALSVTPNSAKLHKTQAHCCTSLWSSSFLFSSHWFQQRPWIVLTHHCPRLSLSSHSILSLYSQAFTRTNTEALRGTLAISTAWCPPPPFLSPCQHWLGPLGVILTGNLPKHLLNLTIFFYHHTLVISNGYSLHNCNTI